MSSGRFLPKKGIYNMGKKKKRNVTALKKKPKSQPCSSQAKCNTTEVFSEAFRHHQAGRLNKAERFYKKIINVNPNHADALLLLGLITQGRGKTDEAVSLFQRAVHSNPHHPTYYLHFGVALLTQKRPEEALACFQKAVDLEPSFAEAFDAMGVALRELDRFEEAIACHQKACQLRPDFVEAYYNLGNAFQGGGHSEDAIRYYQKAIELNPGFVNAYYGLGFAFHGQNRLEEALVCYQRAAELDPENFSAQHQMAMILGDSTGTAPKHYVKELFDQCAPNFEEVLVEKLEYRTPALLRKCMDNLIGTGYCFHNVIDLGCGTGLSGVAFRDISQRLTGLDLSSKMLEKARGKALYDDLRVGDITEYLTDINDRFDLFIAADVFVYVGELKPIFSAVEKCASAGAHFVFSTERVVGKDYVLRDTGRYAHSQSYVEGLARQYGFSVPVCDSAAIRKDKNKVIQGYLFVLQHGGVV
jgi:predicted TPR repeat methyltransferase